MGEAGLAPKVSPMLEEMTGALPGTTGWLRGGVVCIETPQFGFGLVNSFLCDCFAIPPLSCLRHMLLAVVCFKTVLERMLFGASCNVGG